MVPDSDFKSVDKEALEGDFLGNGDIWAALEGDDYQERLLLVMDKCSRTCDIKAANKDYCLLEYQPKNSLIAFETLFKCEEDKALLQTIYPFLSGVENELTLCELAKNDIHGYVLLKFGEAQAMWMFQPLFIGQFNIFRQYLEAKNKRFKFMIAGLGWNIEKITDTFIEIDEGPLYENALKDFLATHPQQTKKDFPSASIDFSYESLCVTADMGIKDAYYFSSYIQNIKEFECCERKFYCLEIEVLAFADPYLDQGMRVNLYVNQNQLNGYCPAIYDNIRGYMQLSAYMSEEQLKNMKTEAFGDDASPYSAFCAKLNWWYFPIMAIIAWKNPIFLLPFVLIYPLALLIGWGVIALKEYFSKQK